MPDPRPADMTNGNDAPMAIQTNISSNDTASRRSFFSIVLIFSIELNGLTNTWNASAMLNLPVGLLKNTNTAARPTASIIMAM